MKKPLAERIAAAKKLFGSIDKPVTKPAVRTSVQTPNVRRKRRVVEKLLQPKCDHRLAVIDKFSCSCKDGVNGRIFGCAVNTRCVLTIKMAERVTEHLAITNARGPIGYCDVCKDCTSLASVSSASNQEKS